MNVDLTQTPNNIHYKRCETTYNEKLEELISNGQVSLRGLRDNAKLFDELIFDINSDYFEKHGGYKFAKEFYERAFHFTEEEMGTNNIISAVMHADELNTALTEEYGKSIYHYHLHVVALPVVRKGVKWTKKCKDKSLIGTTKEVINQVNHSNKWKSKQVLDNQGKPVYDKKGNAVLIKSYSLLQDRFFKYMSDSGYKDFIRGVKGSNQEHLDDLQFKIKKDTERLEKITNKVEEKESSYMKNYEDLFIQEQIAKSTQDEIKKISKNKKELEQAKKRITEIDNLFMHIYEDNISGKLTDERFRNLSFNYDKEQQELKLKIEQLSKEIDNTEKKTTDLTQFISNVKKYTEITKLTPEILNELIEKILVHQTEKVNGKKFKK